jgi:hypothetical protein
MTSFLPAAVSWIALHWWIVVAICALGIAPMCIRGFESEQARIERMRRTQKKQLRALADKILRYSQSVHQRFPNGDVVVGERDLAEQLRGRSDTVVTALNLLLREHKVQKAPLSGYWKLNV